MMSTAPAFLRHARATIPDGIAQEIQRKIDLGELKAGDQLPSVETLASEFEVSRTSVREALQALAALGVIEIKHGRGTFVRSSADGLDGYTTWVREQEYALLELCELRMAVETAAARLAAVKATPETVAKLEHALANMRESVGNLHQIVTWDTAFHEEIIRASGNRLIAQAMALCVDFLTR